MLRLATFNVENLFERPKLLNFLDHAKGDAALAKVRSVQSELAKATYDKPAILALWKDLKAYVTVVEARGKLFNSAKTKVHADGKADWDGWLQLKPDDVSPESRSNTAKVLKTIDADVQCVIEAESRPALKRFNSQEMDSKQFDHIMLVDGNDDRGIDVGLFSRLPITDLRSHIDDRDAQGEVFSRDCLEARIELPGGKVLWILLNHFKSKGYGPQAKNDAKRERQARRVAAILAARYNLATDLVAVCGDLNDTPTSAPLAPLLGVHNLFDVLAVQFPNPADRWTYHYTKNDQIDYLLVSKPLRDAFSTAGIERRGIFDVDKYTGGATKSWPSVDSVRNAASDHGAVWADFNV